MKLFFYSTLTIATLCVQGASAASPDLFKSYMDEYKAITSNPQLVSSPDQSTDQMSQRFALEARFTKLLERVASDAILPAEEKYAFFQTMALSNKLNRNQLVAVRDAIDASKDKNFAEKKNDARRLISLRLMKKQDAALACEIAYATPINNYTKKGSFWVNLNDILEKEGSGESPLSKNSGQIAVTDVDASISQCAANVNKAMAIAKDVANPMYGLAVQRVLTQGRFADQAQ